MLLPSCINSNPLLMSGSGMERLTHDGDVACAVEGIVGAADLVGAALRHVDEMRNQIAASLFRIDEVGHAEALAPIASWRC